ncbi:Uncharacterised protein [Mycobacterium tuberculosis]|nr:Uncharacterised protein [Mycobacterium tuberculosis]
MIFKLGTREFCSDITSYLSIFIHFESSFSMLKVLVVRIYLCPHDLSSILCYSKDQSVISEVS